MEIKPHTKYFELHRGLMTSIAYRMLGVFTDAEDVVQEAYIRWQKVDLKRIDAHSAFLATTVSHLCIDRLRKQKSEKLNYIGPWLPEPIDASQEESMLCPELQTIRAEDISTAFLLVLETLTPLERAVFILKEAFDIHHLDIADMLDINASHSRQLFRRAKSRIKSTESNNTIDATAPRQVQYNDQKSKDMLAAFFSAAVDGDLNTLQSMMTDDIVAYSDGGGRATAAIIPLVGTKQVATVLLHLAKKYEGNLRYDLSRVNGHLGLVIKDTRDNSLISINTIEIEDAKISKIYVMRNPDKLTNPAW